MIKPSKKSLIFLALAFCLGLTSCGVQALKNDDSSAAESSVLSNVPFDVANGEASAESVLHDEGHLLVKLPYGTVLSSDRLSSMNIESLERLYANSEWSLATLKDQNATQTLHYLRKTGLFSSVDYNYFNSKDGTVEAVDGNPSYGEESYLSQINAPAAWTALANQNVASGGSSSVTIAVIDTGVDYTHEDLSNNIWINSKEIAGNGIDDDNNGYVDDVRGWNFVADPSTALASDPMDDNGHGTHVAGIIAAENNTVGIVGVAYHCKVMALKAGNSSGNFLDSNVAKAIAYAANNGADIINMSFGGVALSLAVKDALEEANSKALLVASAGNGGYMTEASSSFDCKVAPYYPAALPFVLGVMSVGSANARSGFSNFDSVPGSSVEYEIYAPGENVLSCLPGNQYAKMSGTSMAAPLVSGAAALLRSLQGDKNAYPNRYLMAQLVATSSTDVSNSTLKGEAKILDAARALTINAKPNLNAETFYYFDDASISSSNNGNGMLDAGETIQMAVDLINRGSAAKSISARLGSSDPYITVTSGSVAYPDIGSFNEGANGLIKDKNGVVTGTSTPFTLVISNECPNEYYCTLYVYASWKSADDSDTKTYSGDGKITVLIHHATILPTLISADTTLDGNTLYILPKNMIVAAGVTLTLAPGCHIQWYADSASYYQEDVSGANSVCLINNGTIIAKGTAEKPLVFTMSALFALSQNHNCVFVGNSFDLSYAIATNLTGSFSTIDHCSLNYESLQTSNDTSLYANSIMYSSMVGVSSFFKGSAQNFEHNVVAMSKCDAFMPRDAFGIHSTCIGNVFYATQREALYNYQPSWLSWSKPLSFIFYRHYDANGAVVSYVNDAGVSQTGYVVAGPTIQDNAFLGAPYATAKEQWMTLETNDIEKDKRNSDGTLFQKMVMEQTYFNQVPEDEKAVMAYDYCDTGKTCLLDYTSSPYVEGTTDLSTLWPFVKSVRLFDKDGNAITTVSDNYAKVIVDFNRPMDTSKALQVGFGSVLPYDDYLIPGSYVTSSEWVGEYSFPARIEGGNQFFRIWDGQSSDGLPLLTEVQRFSFTLERNSTISASFTATPLTSGAIQLDWAAYEQETLMAYSVCRSDEKDGNYVTLNSKAIPLGTTTYLDQNTVAGKTYWYSVKGLLTDLSEVTLYGRISAAPLDSVAPTISIDPVTVGYLNHDLRISCWASDNITVKSVTLFFRKVGESTYQTRAMPWAFNDCYGCTIFANEFDLSGLEYYVEVNDGINTVRSGSADSPYQITIKDDSALARKGDVNGDGVITAIDAQMILHHLDGSITLSDEQFRRADLNGDNVLSSYEALMILQYINGKIQTLDLTSGG
jgi:subtilisin family serine protease